MTPSGGWLPAVIAGKTGIGMSQRMQSFVLDAADDPLNVVAPGKRPRATLTPSMALKDGKQYEQATTEFKKALDLEPSLTTAIYNAGMTYSDWYDKSHSNDHRDRAKEYLQKYVSSAGTKDGGFGYVKAANDKLYALSGS